MWSKLAAGQQRRLVEAVWKHGKSCVKLSLRQLLAYPVQNSKNVFLQTAIRQWAHPVQDSKNVFIKIAIRHVSQPRSVAFLPILRFLSSKLFQFGFAWVAIAHQGDECFAAKAVSSEISALLFEGFGRDVTNKPDYSTFNNDDSDITIISDNGEYNSFPDLSDKIENDFSEYSLEENNTEEVTSFDNYSTFNDDDSDITIISDNGEYNSFQDLGDDIENDFSEYSLGENNTEEVTSFDIELSNVVHHHIEETIQRNYVKVFDEVTRTQENITSLSSTANRLFDHIKFLESELSIIRCRIKELEHSLNVEQEGNKKLENENKRLSDEKRSLNITCVQCITQIKEMCDILMKSMNGMENSDKALNMDGDHDYGVISNGFQATFRPQSSDQWMMM